MQTRFKKKAKIADILITSVGGTLSVGIMLYAILHFGLGEAWPELVLNLFYIACLTMIWMYFFNRLDSQQFNYWCSICISVTVLLRDILFAPPLSYYLCTPPGVSRPLSTVALHAHLLLCPQELEELHQGQPVDDLCRRHRHCCSLQPRHLYGAHQ